MKILSFKSLPVWLALAAACLFTALSAAPAFATAVMALGDDQLTASADAICYASVTDVRTVAFDDQILLTAVDVDVIEWLKGGGDHPPQSYTFYTRGGSANGFAQTVAGEAQFAKNQTAVVFLQKIKKYNNLPMVLGLSQGAFYVSAPEKTRAAKATIQRHITVTRLPHDIASDFDQAESIDELLVLIRQQIQETTKHE